MIFYRFKSSIFTWLHLLNDFMNKWSFCSFLPIRFSYEVHIWTLILFHLAAQIWKLRGRTWDENLMSSRWSRMQASNIPEYNGCFDFTLSTHCDVHLCFCCQYTFIIYYVFPSEYWKQQHFSLFIPFPNTEEIDTTK